MDEFWASIGRILEGMPVFLIAPALMGGVIWYAIRIENKAKAPDTTGSKLDEMSETLDDVHNKVSILLDRVKR